MTSLLIELYDRHTIEKNVYQAFVSDCDEILFLSGRKIAEEEKLSLSLRQNDFSASKRESHVSCDSLF